MTTPRSVISARWALLTAAPAPLVLIGWWRGSSVEHAPVEAVVPAVLALLLLVAGAALLPSRPGRAHLLAGLGLIALIAVAAPALVASPALALLVSLVVLVSLLVLRRIIVRFTRGPPPVPSAAPPRAINWLYAFRGGGVATSVLWLFSTLAGSLQHGDVVGYAALAVSGASSAALLLAWSLGVSFRRHPVRVVALLLATLAAIFFLAANGLDPENLSDALCSLVVLGLIILSRTESEGAGYWELVLGHPARLLVATFAILCTVGTILLALPRASTSGHGIPLSDASFVSVSAVCVTGLSTIDVGTVLSPLGQFFLLVLIQAGGLGIMTFSTAAMRLIGGRLSLRHEGAMAQLVSPEDRSQIFASTIQLIVFTLAVEALGAVCLWLAFTGAGEDPGHAVWPALFTAVSAFCNAGFGLRPDNLVGFAGDPAVLHIVALLIIFGGLSPAVVLAIPRWARRRSIPAQARLALVTTAALLFIGFVTFLALEWSGALGGHAWYDKLHNAWFQSVTLRTAGFNSIDLTTTQPATLAMMMVLMLIGGSPGGTAGGFKTTTLGVLALSVAATVRGKREIVFAGRRIGSRTFLKATAVTSVFLLTALGGMIALFITQSMPVRVSAFETVSALGTVGLSINGTPNLDAVGRVIVMGLMFVGRVGPLTLFMFLSRERQRDDAWRHPETDIEVA